MGQDELDSQESLQASQERGHDADSVGALARSHPGSRCPLGKRVSSTGAADDAVASGACGARDDGEGQSRPATTKARQGVSDIQNPKAETPKKEKRRTRGA